MSWMCKFFEHKPNRETMESRELMPDWPFPEHNIAARVDWEADYHHERYTTCVRCGEEISYMRFFNWYGNRARVEATGRLWLERKDATSVRDTF